MYKINYEDAKLSRKLKADALDAKSHNCSQTKLDAIFVVLGHKLGLPCRLDVTLSISMFVFILILFLKELAKVLER